MDNKIHEAIRAAGGGTILAAATGLSRQAIYKWAQKGFPENGELEEEEIIDVILQNITISNMGHDIRGQRKTVITRDELKQASRALKRSR